MALLNINGIRPHIDERRIFLTSTKIDIIAINETKVDSNVLHYEISISGFDIIRKDGRINGRQGGGVCFYVQNDISYAVRNDFDHQYLECLTIEIRNINSKPFLLSTWYRPPNSTVALFDTFEDMMKKIDSTNLELYLLGDLNCNFIHDNRDSNSKKLKNICDIYGLTQLITEPTRVSKSSTSVIDLSLTNSPEPLIKSGVYNLGISDHSLIFSVRKLNNTNSTKIRTVRKRQYKHFNNEIFIKELKQKPWHEMDMYENPDDMWRIRKKYFLITTDNNAPFKTKRTRNKIPPWLTNDVIQIIHRRDSLKKKASKDKDPENWINYKNARNSVNNAIRCAKSKYYLQKIKDSKDNPRQSWKIINELSSRNLKPTSPIPR